MKEYIVFGVGSPIRVNSTCPEGAELIVVEEFRVSVDNLTTLRADDVMLSGTGIHNRAG